MRPLLWPLIATSFLLAVAACASEQSSDSTAPVDRSLVQDRVTARSDGSLITWRIDRQGHSDRQGIVVLAQGSGCLPTSENENIAKFRALAPHHAVLTVEKYGVARGKESDVPSATSGPEDCSADYFKGHTVSQRVEDYLRVISELRQEPWWNGRVVLFGGSEGGAAVAMLAPRLENLSAVIIMSTGTGIAMADWIKSVLPPPVAAQADDVFARIRANPTSGEVWGGNSWKWWADIMDRVLADDLLKVKAPILLIHGELDQFAPVAAARATRGRFESSRNDNLTYLEKSGLDHFMNDPKGGKHLADVLKEAREWLALKAIDP